MSIMYVGVGDIRNALSTLNAVDSDNAVNFCLNDFSSFTLARDVVILVLGSLDTVSGIAAWCDFKISRNTSNQLKTALEQLCQNKFPEWMTFHCTEQLSCHWNLWLECLGDESKSASLDTIRTETVSRGGGHDRVGVSECWRKSGIASFTEHDAKQFEILNPLLFDLSSCQYMEVQGPGASFSALEPFTIGTTEFAQTLFNCWDVLFSNFRNRSNVAFHFVVGDCVMLGLGGQLGCGYDVIDTSNLMDYLGLWNLLVTFGPLLTPVSGSFIVTEQILGNSETINDMLVELIPHDADISKFLALLIGLEVGDLPSVLKPKSIEKVMLARWTRGSIQDSWHTFTSDFSRSLKQKKKLALREIKPLLSESVFSSLRTLWLSEISQAHVIAEDSRHPDKEVHRFVKFCKEQSNTLESEMNAQLVSDVYKFMNAVFAPVHLTEEMLTDVYRAVELSYPFPSSTIGTFVTFFKLAARMDHGSNLIAGTLDRFFQDPSFFDHTQIRNRLLEMCIQSKIFFDELKPALNHSDNHHPLFHQVLDSNLVNYSCVISPIRDILKPKGGILEPALAVFLVRNDKVLKKIEKANGMWSKDGDLSLNMVYEFVNDSQYEDIQILDSLCFDSSCYRLTFPLPEIIYSRKSELLRFKFLVLVDIQEFRILSAPVELRTLSVK